MAGLGDVVRMAKRSMRDTVSERWVSDTDGAVKIRYSRLCPLDFWWKASAGSLVTSLGKARSCVSSLASVYSQCRLPLHKVWKKS